ncbi:MAG: nitrate- and nitrite sensing domain-containing protein [Pseudomonadota bacterium]|nr:nitrate- and nitrite sensing domain-containing protein [Pseudomonadota bacterium]
MTTEKNTPLSATDYLIASKQAEIQSLNYLLHMGQLVVMISDLIHALQKERGASNIYLGSKGSQFEQSLQQLIGQTNQHLQAFHQTLSTIHAEISSHAGNSRLLNRIAYVVHGLAGLDGVRHQIHALNIRPDLAIRVYSELISGLLTIVFETADAAVDPTIARVLVAMFNLMHGKELAGQERAVGAAGFAVGTFTAADIQRMQHLIDAQERCFELFTEFANPAALALWQQYASRPYLIDIERLRRIAFTGTPPHRAEQSDHWFDLLTQRIDDLKSVETALEVYLQQLCEQKVHDANASLNQQQDLIQTLGEDAAEGFVVFLTGHDSASLKPASLDQYHPEGLSPRLGRSVFELVQHQAQRLQHMHDELEAARTALEERKLQQKAKALLIKHRKLTEDEAHRLLRQMAMDQGKKLVDVSRAIIEMAEIWRVS